MGRPLELAEFMSLDEGGKRGGRGGGRGEGGKEGEKGGGGGGEGKGKEEKEGKEWGGEHTHLKIRQYVQIYHFFQFLPKENKKGNNLNNK